VIGFGCYAVFCSYLRLAFNSAFSFFRASFSASIILMVAFNSRMKSLIAKHKEQAGNSSYGECTRMKSLLSAFLIAVMIGGFGLACTLQLDKVQASTDISDIPKPSVPEFTIKLVDSSYDIPPTSSVDPYTGQTVTQAGRHVESRTIKLSIKNQPFTPFQVEDENGNSWAVDFQYNIRWKGHFEQDWHEIYIPTNGFAGANLESEYTVISFEGEYSSSEGLKLYYQGLIATFPPDAQVDFQVEAMIGYVSRYPVPFTSGWTFTGEESGWSNTQTLTIGESQTPTSSPANSPTPSPEAPQSEIVTIVAVIIVAAVFSAALGLLIYLIKRK
jgi:hypothetical protein